MANHLIQEKSPYLLQHAHNPVDWYPWGEEAFEKARRENKPILLSIGYATCHWCHVMERESFENESIAALLNRDFVCIKLDREERPEIDRLYMMAVQALTGQGGWPLNVFLTPKLEPFFGGTYFPPVSRWERPGFAEVLGQIAATWRAQGERVRASGGQLLKVIEQFAATSPGKVPVETVSFEKALDEFAAAYDEALGGFGPAPKFPMPANLNLLLRLHATRKDPRALEMAVATLKAMARGGLYDHLGGGFHRYSTDEQWRVPHFEKMLYDNAQLAVCYLEAYQVTADESLAAVARGTLDYLLRELSRPDGAFLSAEDADSLPAGSGQDGRKTEGAFYLWTKEEILRLAGEDDGELFCLRYGAQPGGNALSDPQGEFGQRNVLYLGLDLEEAARERKLSVEEAARKIEAVRLKLLEARSARPRPDVDDLVVAGWNGLAITAMAKGFQALGERRYLDAAQAAARFLRRHLYDEKTATLQRRWRDGETRGPGVADDYSCLVQGLLDLYESDFDPAWLDWAVVLTERQLLLFFDEAGGGFYMTAPDHDPRLLVRMKETQDNVEPAASSIAALNLLRLSRLLGREDFRQAAGKTLEGFAEQMADSPRSLPQMLVALDLLRARPREIVIAGRRGAPDTEALLARVRRQFLPHAVVLLADSDAGPDGRTARLPALTAMRPLGGKAAAYVCSDFACQAPVTEPERLDGLLG